VHLELDHVFSFVSEDAREAAVLEAAGFSLLPPGTHRGQGTANRSVAFADTYLELIHLAVRADAEASELRLDRRSDFATTGHCPFGIGLRAVVPDPDPATFEAYRPPWGTPDYPPMLLLRACLEHPGLPIIFVSQPPGTTTLQGMRPGAWRRLGPAHLTHRSGATGIDAVEITVPDARGWPPVPPPPRVTVRAGSRFHATVRLAGTMRAAVEVTPWLTLAPA
jgi:hypothetical protein